MACTLEDTMCFYRSVGMVSEDAINEKRGVSSKKMAVTGNSNESDSAGVLRPQTLLPQSDVKNRPEERCEDSLHMPIPSNHKMHVI